MISVTIFEDNHQLREGLFQLIHGTDGFECVGSYPNCDDLLVKMELDKPDVVLMDIQMPGMNGIEAVKLIKENFPDTKILMETIFHDDEKIFSSICAGAEGYMLKNTAPIKILEAIQDVYDGGSPMTPSIANRVLKMVKEKSGSDTKKISFDLTEREKEILACLVEGMSYKMIGDNCFISIDTVNNHIKSIYKKLQVHSKSEAVVKAIRGKIV